MVTVWRGVLVRTAPQTREGQVIRSRRSTLDDVAELAQVSAITVSRALRKPEMVSAELRKRIDAAVHKLAFVPNFAASRLALARSHSVGVIVSSLSNGIFADYLGGLYDTLLKAGFQVVVLSSRYSAEEEEKAIKTLLGQQIEALIVAGIDQTPHARRLLQRSGVPVVQTFELADDPIDIKVGLSQRQAGYEATRFLLGLGHRRVGFIAGQLDARATARFTGYRRATKEAGINSEKLSLTYSQPSTVTLGGRMLSELLAKSGGLDALFCCDDNLALGALFECQRRGIRVPGAMSILGFNDLEFAVSAEPSLSSVATPRYEMGRIAAEMVMKVIATGKRPRQRKIDVGFTIQARASTARASA